MVRVLLGFLKKEVLLRFLLCRQAGGVKGVCAWGENELDNAFGGLVPLIGPQKVYNF